MVGSLENYYGVVSNDINVGGLWGVVLLIMYSWCL